MEPSIVKEFLKTCLPGYHREIEDLFSPTHARKQTAKAILLFLSGKKRKVFKNTMNCVIDMYRSKEIPTCDSAMAEENGLFENTEMLLDDIDSSIINDTFEKIGDVPFDIVQKCSPGSGRKRKERAKTFYDFVNLNKEHLQIFKNILQSNAD
ncbi:uncharacterized protein LOC133180289 [Saccostrea echinata]|uniref:uncharacterized protein LOC133180289 n=1 Tax=Saccostrea echinata TaxID=191078 RepID=UPI002A8411BB|nr:uncharacterized protein LOC133180289 [Saccostrea echinata]